MCAAMLNALLADDGHHVRVTSVLFGRLSAQLRGHYTPGCLSAFPTARTDLDVCVPRDASVKLPAGLRERTVPSDVARIISDRAEELGDGCEVRRARLSRGSVLAAHVSVTANAVDVARILDDLPAESRILIVATASIPELASGLDRLTFPGASTLRLVPEDLEWLARATTSPRIPFVFRTDTAISASP